MCGGDLCGQGQPPYPPPCRTWLRGFSPLHQHPFSSGPSGLPEEGCAVQSFSPMEAGEQEVAVSVPGLRREQMSGLLAFGKAQVTTRS